MEKLNLDKKKTMPKIYSSDKESTSFLNHCQFLKKPSHLQKKV